jgi:hypothetical protein
MVNKPGYLDADFEHFGLQRAKSAATPGLVISMSSDKPEEYLTLEETSFYRSTVGKLQWLVPLRPDIAFMAKELSRPLQQPTTESNHLLKRLLRYMKGAQDVHFRICPKIQLQVGTSMDLVAYTDSDWAGCRSTRKSTSGGIIYFLDSPIAFYSRTQTVQIRHSQT